MESCLTQIDIERYESGSLDEDTAAAFRGHLDHCGTCRERLLCFQEDQALAADVHRVLVSSDDAPCDDETVGLPGEEKAKHLPRIEGYRIIDVLGQGGMGIVYRAVQTRLNRSVALKVLPALVGSASPSAVVRFQREATAAARLHHTNIIPIYDFGESTDGHYCAMELVSGQPLNVVIKRFAELNASTASPARLADLLQSIAPGHQSFDSAASDPEQSRVDVESGSAASSLGRGRLYFCQVARWMADAADALHYAHGEGVIHRDIKPGNLILSTDGRIMIADFGLAKSIDDESVTMTGSLLGTLRYMSPEQAMAKRMRVDLRTDIYSLGTTMYELLTFRPAVPGLDDKEILGRIITTEPVAPRKIVPSVPRDLETICVKSMEKSPDARYDTARAMAEDLRRFINDLPVIAKSPGPLARLAKFAKRRKAAVASLVLLMVLAAIVPLLVITENQRRLSEDQRRSSEISRIAEVANGYVIAEQWQDAITKYEELIALVPKHLYGLGNLAHALKERYNELDREGGQADPALLNRALDVLDQAIAVDSSDAWSWSTKGVILKKLDQLGEAVRCYERARTLDVNSPPAWVNLSVAKALNGDISAAEQDALRAAELATEPNHRLFAWRTLAALQLFNGNPAAVESCKKAIEAKRIDEISWLLLAKAQLAEGGNAGRAAALESAQHADFLADGKIPKTSRIRALVELAGGRNQEALDHAARALDADDFPAANSLILAAAEAGLGHLELARHHLDQAEHQWPDELRDASSFIVTADAGVLWIETHAALAHIQSLAQTALNGDVQ